MTAHADNHISLRVSDIERSIAFYEHAFGGRVVVPIGLREGPYISDVFGPGTRVLSCHVKLDANALELWQFLEPELPFPRVAQNAIGMMHFGVTVDDVPATLARVEEAGGRGLFPIKNIGGQEGAHMVYCEDLDGHVFELMDKDHPTITQMLLAAYPPAAAS
jgi:catechol 2,3-dioxygenase-like lactoylglutathione lyase family enzyme